MRLRATLLLGLLAGCATPASNRPEAPARTTGPTVDLQALTAREVPPLTRWRVSAPDGSFTGEVEASAEPSFQRQPGLLILSIPVGTRSPVTCFIHAEPLDAGGALYRMLELAGRHTEIQRVRTTDVRLIGDTPTVYAEAQYLVDTPRGKAAGLAKLMVHPHERVPLVCSHDELGYSESFQRMTRGLAGSLKGAGEEKPAPRYAEFHVLRVRGHPVGFEKRTLREAAGGSRLTEVEMSLFFPRSPRELLAQDTVSRELADKEGRLVALDYARATNGELDIQMSLEQVKGREYHYEGRHSGKALNGTFTAARGLTTDPGTARLLREQLLPGRKQELVLEAYSPSANPVAPLPQVWRKASPEGREVTVETGPVKATLTVDAQGMVERAVVPMDGLELVRERVSATGSP